MTTTDRADHGFSFVELLIALAVLLAAAGALLQVTASGQRLTRSQAEATDLHQRLRVAAERLQKDLAHAGAGAARGPLSGGLTGFLAPLVPARLGARNADPPGSAFTDRVSVLHVMDGAWPARLTVDMATASDAVPISATALGCPPVGLCGFAEGTRALIVDTEGVGAGHDVFTVTGIAGELAHDAPNPPLQRPYAAATSVVVPVVQRVYHLDRVTRRLMVYDGFQSDMPLVDNVLDLRLTYFVDASPASVSRPPDGTGNCAYEAGSPPIPRLEDLGGEGLAELVPAQLTDGPYCGAGLFDADLLRIRLVRVTIRLEAASDVVRGAGPLFTRPGRSPSGDSYVPDYEVTFEVAPRNMTPVLAR